MLYGIDILLARMKTHPEEFVCNGKWTGVLVNIDKHLTEEERQALKNGFTDMARDTFNEVIMKSIAGEGVDYDKVASIAQDYDSVMAYPKERAKMLEEENKQRREYELAQERMRIEQQRAMQNTNYARGIGAGLMGNQAGGFY